MSEYIQVQNLKRVYKPSKEVIVNALNGLNFSIEKGDLISVIGILGGLDWNYTGDIIVDGKDIKQYNQNFYRRFIVGTIFQQFYLIPSLTVEENILLPTKFVKSMNKYELNKRLEYILKETELTDRRKYYPNQLSGGQAQRVAIARAMIDSPKILLADEPTGNLDSKTGESIINLIKTLNKQEGITTIIVTHDMKIAKQTNKIITLVDGKNV